MKTSPTKWINRHMTGPSPLEVGDTMIEHQKDPVMYDLTHGFRPIIDSPMSEDTGHPPKLSRLVQILPGMFIRVTFATATGGPPPLEVGDTMIEHQGYPVMYDLRSRARTSSTDSLRNEPV